MDVMEKLVELMNEMQDSGIVETPAGFGFTKQYIENERIASHLIANGATAQECARTLEEWGEDYGDVLWWKFPIEEPPYVGSPLDEKWPAYHTHWTPIVVPQPPKGE